MGVGAHAGEHGQGGWPAKKGASATGAPYTRHCMDAADVQIRVLVSERPIAPEAIYDEIQDDRAGASVVFTGTVRNHAPGKTDVSHLEYEAHPEQVEGKIGEVVAEATERWPLLRVAVEHRIGSLGIRDVAVCVGVSSAHRAEAFDGARYIIDELKHRVPIWKKEHWPGGAEWVEGA